ncbi:MAG TPA: trimethylamine methyltransferase family protein [Dongiaceae bacterium]|nr:trimethylamine methyltransferase family protein [Dongiaceae bacterium]
MTEAAKLRRRDRSGRTGGFRQLPFARLRNPYPPMQLLGADQIEAIHEASLRLLAEVGVEVMHAESRRILKTAGAEVDEASLRVRCDPALIEAAVARAPSSFVIRARDPAKSIEIGPGHLVFSSVGGPAFANDLDRGRRAGNSADMRDYIKLVQSLNIIHQEGGGPIEPTDLPAESRHLDFYEAALTLTDKSWECWALGGYRVRDALEMISIAYGIPRARMHEQVTAITVINSNSPLRLDGPMGEGLVELARSGQASILTPFTLAGAMSPVTLMGAIVQQNAEALFMVALAQLARAGAPVVYGGFTSNVDMRSGAPAFGTPEYTKSAMVSGQLARRYKLPFRSSNVTSSNCVDVQAAYESGMSLWGAVMGGANLLLHCAGWLEGGLTASFEKLIVDAEMLQMMREFLQPFDTADVDKAMAAIAEVGPGGHFFGVGHTLERFETAFYAPLLSDWRNFETWQEAGSIDGTRRAHAIWKELLARYEPPPMDPAVRDELAAYVARRKREIAAGRL